MGKLKIADYKNNYPLYPNSFKLCIELVGEAIKLSCDDGKQIKLKTRDDFNHYRVETKIKWACDLLKDSIELE